MRSKSGYYLAAFLMDMVGAIGVFSLSLFAKERFHGSQFEIGTIQAMGAAFYVIGCPSLGHLSESTGRKSMLMASVLLFSATHLLIGMSSQIWQLYCLSACVGISLAMFWPALEAGVADGEPLSQLTRKLARLNLAWCTGFGCGLWIGGPLNDLERSIPFYVAACFGLGLFAVIVLAVRDSSPGKDIAESGQNDSRETERPFQADSFLYMAWTSNFAMYAMLGIMRTLFAPDITERASYSATKAAIAVSMITLFQTMTFFVLMRSEKWKYGLKTFCSTQLIAIIGLVVVCQTTNLIALLTAFSLVGIGCGVTYQSSLYYSLERRFDKGRKAGSHESILGAGRFLGPFLAGGMVRLTNDNRSQYVLAIAVCVVGLVVQYVIFKRSKRRRLG